MVSLVGIFTVNTLFVALPSTNPLNMFFEVEQFTGDVGYKWNVTIGIILCGVLTYIAEKVIAIYLTSYFDRKGEAQKAQTFKERMKALE